MTVIHVVTDAALQATRMSFDTVNGLDGGDVCRKGESGACCKASREVAQVSQLITSGQIRPTRVRDVVMTQLSFVVARNACPSREENSDAGKAGIF